METGTTGSATGELYGSRVVVEQSILREWSLTFPFLCRHHECSIAFSFTIVQDSFFINISAVAFRDVKDLVQLEMLRLGLGHLS